MNSQLKLRPQLVIRIYINRKDYFVKQNVPTRKRLTHQSKRICILKYFLLSESYKLIKQIIPKMILRSRL
jgi:hypothetical protein